MSARLDSLRGGGSWHRLACLAVVACAVLGSIWPVPALAAAPAAAEGGSANLAVETTVRLELASTRELAIAAPLKFLRIGEQHIAIAGGAAVLLSAEGETKAIAGWRELPDWTGASDAHHGYVIAAGGSERSPAEVWRLGLNPGGLTWERLGVLPVSCARPVAAVQGGDLYVVGQGANGAPVCLRLRLADGHSEVLAAPPQLQAAGSLGAQGNALYLAGRDAGGEARLWRWKNQAWLPAGGPAGELLEIPPVPFGPAHLLYARANPAAPLIAYHTITDTWTVVPATPGETVALLARPSGVRRVVRSPGGGLVLQTEDLVRPKRGLGALDYALLAGYFLLNLGIGAFCSRRKTSSDDYFRGGGRLQWWALGISYMATAMSSISFMVYPAVAYATDWLMIGVPLFQSAAVVAAGFLFIGLFRRLNITTVFEYLGLRFGRAIRLLGATLMILSQVGGRLSIVMLLPSLAFSAVTGLNAHVSVGLMGGVTLLYCLKGGMKAVVWTDVLQFGLMYGTVVITVVTIAHEVPGGMGGLIAVARAEGKFEAFLFDWDFVRPSVWVFSCLAVTTVFLQLGDQSLMQRALSAPDERAARGSVVLAGVLGLPIAILLFFIGSALFVFYRQQPGLLDPGLPNDSILPHFVGNQLPRGVVGLIIAGIFAAAMSTVSGTVNAIAATVVRDFLLPYRPACSEPTRMRVAQATTVLVGASATAIALWMAGMNLKSLWETFATLMALIGGGFPGIFALGLLTRRANAPGVAIGLAGSMAVTFVVKYHTATNVFLFTSVAVGSCIVLGYAASLLFPPPAQSLDGLTVSSLWHRAKAAPVGSPEVAP
jgi:SSS family transporter